MKILEVPSNLARKDLFAWLKKNQAALIQQKKCIGKKSDGLAYFGSVYNSKGVARKAMLDEPLPDDGILNVKAAINTTNFLDSCLDVHMPGLWSKSLSENKMLMHLQEHDMVFDKIIADGADLKAYTKNYTWKDLGYSYKGKTEALIFDSTVREERNDFMYDQYAKGYVKNHSVYMMYVKMVMCINEPEDLSFGAEYEAWQKYFSEIANKEIADEKGYFWSILEAKVIEGSAVPIGANTITPTLSVTQGKDGNEPLKSTPKFNVPNIALPAKGFGFGGLKFQQMVK